MNTLLSNADDAELLDDEVCALSLQPIAANARVWRCTCGCATLAPYMKHYALRALMANENGDVYCPIRCGHRLSDAELRELGFSPMSVPRNDAFASLLRGEIPCADASCAGYCAPLGSRFGRGASSRRARCVACSTVACLRCGGRYSDRHAVLGCDPSAAAACAALPVAVAGAAAVLATGAVAVAAEAVAIPLSGVAAGVGYVGAAKGDRRRNARAYARRTYMAPLRLASSTTGAISAKATPVLAAATPFACAPACGAEDD